MTPEQVDAVEASLASVPFDRLTERFYLHLFALEPAARGMFPDDLTVLRRKLAAELDLVVSSIRHHDDFLRRVRDLAGVHGRHGVRAAHVRSGGLALGAAFADVLGPVWTPELAAAWQRVYHLTTEAMMAAMSEAEVRDPM